MAGARVQRIHYGYIVVPEEYPDAHQPLPVCGYLVQTAKSVVLFDTGMSPVNEEARSAYHPRSRTPDTALAAIGLAVTDVDLIANCHLHFDHAGGNSWFPGVPIVVQRAELEAAREPDYTFPQYAYDFPDARMVEIQGEHELAPGVRLVPTPGHTPGHQSLLVDTDDGRILLAGQAANTTWEFSSSAFAERLASSGLDVIGTHPDWMAGLRDWKVQRVYFAHDLVVWERDPADIGQPQLI